MKKEIERLNERVFEDYSAEARRQVKDSKIGVSIDYQKVDGNDLIAKAYQKNFDEDNKKRVLTVLNAVKEIKSQINPSENISLSDCARALEKIKGLEFSTLDNPAVSKKPVVDSNDLEADQKIKKRFEKFSNISPGNTKEETLFNALSTYQKSIDLNTMKLGVELSKNPAQDKFAIVINSPIINQDGSPLTTIVMDRAQAQDLYNNLQSVKDMAYKYTSSAYNFKSTAKASGPKI